MSHDSHASFSFGGLTWLDQTLTLAFIYYKAVTYRYTNFFFTLRSVLVKFGLTAVISPVSVADKAKSDGSEL